MSREPEDTAVADPITRTVRVCDDLCSTCIYRPGNLMHLKPGRLQGMTDEAVEQEGHVVCHQTLGTTEPAICAGFARHPLGRLRSLALRLVRGGILTIRYVTPKKEN